MDAARASTAGLAWGSHILKMEAISLVIGSKRGSCSVGLGNPSGNKLHDCLHRIRWHFLPQRGHGIDARPATEPCEKGVSLQSHMSRP